MQKILLKEKKQHKKQKENIYDEEHKQLIGEITGKTFKLGDPIKIQVIDAKKDTRRIDFARIKSE